MTREPVMPDLLTLLVDFASARKSARKPAACARLEWLKQTILCRFRQCRSCNRDTELLMHSSDLLYHILDLQSFPSPQAACSVS